MIHQLSDKLWEHRYGVLGVLVIHFGFFVYSNIKTIENIPLYEPLIHTDNRIEMDFRTVPDPIEPPKEEIVTDAFGDVTNKSFNEADKREGASENYDSRFSKSAVDEKVMNDLKSLEKSTFDELAGKKQKTNPQHTTDGNSQNKNKTEEGTTTTGSSSGGMKGRPIVSYNLPFRRDEKLPIPGYRCIGSGVVVVNIKVSLNGNVISAEIDKKQSLYREECMALDALEYAKRAKFSASSMAQNPQDGTITYTYVGQ